MSRKRKAELDIEADRTLHASFAQAAKSLSLLYTSAVQQHRIAHVEGARHALERQLAWLQAEYGHSSSVPLTALVQRLHEELQSADLWSTECSPGQDNSSLCLQENATQIDDTAMELSHQRPQRHAFGMQGSYLSPAKRFASTSGAGGCDRASQSGPGSGFSVPDYFGYQAQ
jgi:hypothetical protein